MHFSLVSSNELFLTTTNNNGHSLIVEAHSAAAQSAQILKYLLLAEVVKRSLNDVRLDLWGEYDFLEDIEFATIVLPALLERRAQWRVLDLRRSRLSLFSIRAFSTCVPLVFGGKGCTLVELCLGSLSLGDDGVRLLASSLPQTTLEALNLFDNSISDAGAVYLSQALPLTMSLKALNLNNNDISDVGASHLVKAATKGRSSIQKLHLNMNAITD